MNLKKFKLALLLLTACSSSNDAKKADSLTGDPSTIFTLSHENGTYNYYPWVIISPVDKSKTYDIKTQLPGEVELDLKSECGGSPYDQDRIHSEEVCREISESGDFKFSIGIFLGDLLAQGTATYNIELNQNDLNVEAKEPDKNFAMTKTLTYCDFDSDDKLGVAIKLKQVDNLPKSYDAYLLFTITNPEPGKSVGITQDNEDNPAGIAIKPESDDVPYSHYSTLDAYTTKQATDISTGKRPESGCSIEITDFERGKVIKGSITCTSLANYSSDIDSSKIPLGKVLNISGNWQCEKYR